MNLLGLPHRLANGTIPGVLLVFMLAYALPRGAPAAVLPSSSMNNQPSGTALIFYAQPQVSDALWPLLFQILRADLAAGAGDLPNGVVLDKQPTIVRGSDDLRGISFSSIVSIKLLGRCDVLPQADHPSLTGPLGWVMLVSGKIQPYIFIDCNRVAQVLRPAAARMNKSGRQYVMAQAISHVLIHEWSHIAAQSSAHSRRGLTQPYLSIDDLIAAAKDSQLSASTR